MQPKRLARITHVIKQRQGGFIIVLEDIHDPHNAAAILRTCDALGIQTVYFIFEKKEKYNPKNIGKASSSSANKWLDFTYFDDSKACINSLKHDDYTVVATALTDKAESLQSAVFPEKKLAILVGNEHRGLSPEALRLADRIVMIPMKGFVQSLNVSVATAIVLWEITKQRGRKHMLSAAEQQKLLGDFIKRSGK